MADTLPMWTITENPSDHPGKFVARLWLVEGRVIAATTDIHIADDLKAVRAMLPGGLINIGRQPEDDPVIVETWI